jgi:Ca2+/H+ antiporter, TMEM165/GDT1 family
MLEITATAAVIATISEIGDKTQVLTFFLATRFTNKKLIMLGIFLATIANHSLAAYLGIYLNHWISPAQLTPVLSGAFIALGLWMLVPETEADTETTATKMNHYGAFIASFVLFFLAEIGDKTQLSTILLAANFNSILWVVMGITLGTMITNIPMIYLASYSMQKLPVKLLQQIAALIFVGFGCYGLYHAQQDSPTSIIEQTSNQIQAWLGTEAPAKSKQLAPQP